MTRQRTRKCSAGCARESHAGHEFHFLWAAHRLVQLLDPRSRLCRVKIEGVGPRDVGRSRRGDEFLAVDLTEYYGGDDFASAAETVVSQVKYSTRNPGREWTIGRLCERGQGQRPLVQALAAVYRGFRQGTGGDIAGRLWIRLVSNQPLAPAVVRVTETARAVYRNDPQCTMHALRARLPNGLRASLDRLLAASKLPAAMQMDFLICLDFGRCGLAALEFQRLALSRHLAASFPGQANVAAERLIGIVRRAALPDAEAHPGIGLDDLLAYFSVTSQRRLLPCPSLLEGPEKTVPTEDARRLARAVVSAGSRPLLVLGNAGTGKSTTLDALGAFMPAGSVVITFDCFGRGEYLDFGGERHPERRFLHHLSNEIAIRCGSPFLVEAPHDPHDLRAAFQDRLEAAAKAIRAGGGILVIAVDAADNAVIAGREGAESSFVPQLWRLRIPDGARVVVSARTERRELLGTPGGLPELRLLGFDAAASAAHLRMTHPVASDAECVQFHNKTNGNPRVQSYLLGLRASLPDTLARAAATPEGVFSELLQDATRFWTHPDRARSHLATLVSLARPVPMKMFAETCGVSMAEAESFCDALRSGLSVEGQRIAFRDEPFETFLRQQFGEEETRGTNVRLAEHFLAIASTDPYAARVVAEHLHRGGRGADLVRLSVDGPEPTPIADKAERLAVQWRRLLLAVPLATGADLSKLLLLAAETARAHGALAALVAARPDLAALHANRESLEKFYLDDGEHLWLGPALWRLSSVYSRHPQLRAAARDALDRAEGWVRRRQALEAQEMDRWHIDANDLSNACLAILSVHGADKAIGWLLRWRPRQVREETIERFARDAAVRIKPDDWSQVSELAIPLRARVVLLAAAAEAGQNPPPPMVRNAISGLYRLTRFRRQLPAFVQHYIPAICELAARIGVSRRTLMAVIDRHGPQTPWHAPSHVVDAHDWEMPIRAALLRAALSNRSVKLTDLLQHRVNRRGERTDLEGERRKLVEHLGHLFEAHRRRIDAVLGRARWRTLRNQYAADLRAWEHKVGERWFRGDWGYVRWAEIVYSTILQDPRNPIPILDAVADLAPRAVPGDHHNLWCQLAAKLLPQPRHAVLGWRLLERAVDAILAQPMPGGDRWRALLDCAAVASEHDSSRGRELYERAVDAAVATQDEAVDVLAFHARVACGAASSVPPVDRVPLAVRLGSSVENHRVLVSESDQLPWGLTVGAMTTLDLPTALAWAGRWDDEGWCDLDESMAPVASAGAECGRIKPPVGLALLRFLGDHREIANSFCELLDAQRAVGSRASTVLADMLSAISLWIQRDMLPQYRDKAAGTVINWAEKHGLEAAAGIEELRRLRDFIRSLPAGANQVVQVPYEGDRAPRSSATRRRCGALRLRIQTAWRADDDADLRACLAEAQRQTPEAERRAFLDFIAGLEFRPFFAVERLAALTDCLRHWSGSAAVRQWGRESLPGLIARVMPALMRYEHAHAEGRRALIALAESVGISIEDAIRPALGSWLQALNAKQSIALAETVMVALSRVEKIHVLKWSLARVESRIAAEIRQSRQAPNGPLPISDVEAIAGFLWAQCGHPDKRTRWRALHAARAIATQDPRVLAALLECARRRDDAGFRSPRQYFYWMSARCWVLLLLRHIAAARPDLLRSHAKALAQLAHEREFPHALARELARNAALAVASRFPDVLSALEQEQLKLMNRPRSCHRKRGHGFERNINAKESRGHRFGFNSIDTLPYWFAPAARVFGLTAEAFRERAEIWVVDRWGQTKAGWWDDPRELRRRDNWRQTTNDHGQAPTIDVRRTYLEFHAMCCVVGECLDVEPVVYDSYEGAPCPFLDWLEGFLDPSDESQSWLADLRVPTPHEREAFGAFPVLEDWLNRRPLKDYDAALKHAGDDDFTVVCGDVNAHDHDRTGGIAVRSFLISPDSGLALLRALQTAEDHTRFDLPIHGQGHELHEHGFEMYGFIGTADGEPGMQEHDPLRRTCHPCQLRQAEDFVGRLGGMVDLLGQQITDSRSRVIVRIERWSDLQNDADHPHRPASSGQQVLVRRDSLLEYLARREMALILEVTLSRNAERDHRKDYEDYDLGTPRFYLLRPNGRIETVAGCCETRPAPRARIGNRREQ